MPERPAPPAPSSETVAANPVPVGREWSPVRIVIPAIDVQADLEPLHRGADGTLDTPVDWSHAGWYSDGVAPGDQGPAVIVGHLDSASAGPAVFYKLPELQPGDAVFIERSDGRTQRFVVDTTSQFAKAGFPTDAVYGPTPLPELRLITCVGDFDDRTRNYLDNLVVTAFAA